MFLASCGGRSAQLFRTYPFSDERKLRNKPHTRCYSNRLFHKPPGELLRLLVVDDLQGELSRIYKLLQLTLTIPATGAEAERLFSCLRRMKTYPRNTCGQGRLVNLATDSHWSCCFGSKDRLLTTTMKSRGTNWSGWVVSFDRLYHRIVLIRSAEVVVRLLYHVQQPCRAVYSRRYWVVLSPSFWQIKWKGNVEYLCILQVLFDMVVKLSFG